MKKKEKEAGGKSEVEEIIRRCKTCNLAMNDINAPYIVAMNYGYRFQGDNKLELYFHIPREGRKVDLLRKSNEVCFEMSLEGEPALPDAPSKPERFFSTVVGFGEAVFLHDIAEKCDALSVLLKHQTGNDASFTEEEAKSVCVFKIVSTNFAGKRKPRRGAQ